MKRYTFEDFCNKYKGKRGISCGINYTDGSRDTLVCTTLSIVLFAIKQSGKQVAFIVSK